MRRLLILLLYIANCQFGLAQCSNWTLKADCGSITANGGVCNGSQTIFCIGDSVGVLNTTVSNVDSSFICWGDGTIDRFVGKFVGCKKHKYSYPADSCVGPDGIPIEIKIGVKDTCYSGLVSFHWITTPIQIKFKPKAKINVDSLVCVGSPVNITNTSCFNSAVPTHLWNFGDGTTSNLENPGTHTYYSAGTYTITYTVTNPCGSSSVTKNVIVKPPTIINPLSNNTDWCSPSSFHPDINSQNAVTFLWSSNPTNNISFTAPIDSQPLIQINSAGQYQIGVDVTGCCSYTSGGNGPYSRCHWDTTFNILQGPSINNTSIPVFCGSATFNPVTYINATGSITQYQWSFQGGIPTSSNSANPGNVSYNTPGVYPIKLIVFSSCGNDTIIDSVRVLPPTIIQPVLSNLSNCAPLVFNVNMNALNAQTTAWSLNPNLGSSITSPNANQTSISISNPGLYTINASASGCCTAPQSVCSWSSQISLQQGPNISSNPIPSFCGNASFNPRTYINPSGNISQYQWSFPGGNPSSSNNALPGNVGYNTPGVYPLTLVVFSSCDTITIVDTVRVLPPTIITPTVSNAGNCVPLSINANMNAQNAQTLIWGINPSINTVISNVNNNQTSININDPGSYTITANATGCCTAPSSVCSWSYQTSLIQGPNITSNPIPSFCGSAVINPSNYFVSSGVINQYNWQFPNGSPSSSSQSIPPTINYNTPGVYPITLTVTNSCGNSTFVDSVRVAAPTIIQPSLVQSGNCTPIIINANINAQNAQTFNWSITPVLGTVIANPTSAQTNIDINNSGTYTVQANATGCCTAPQSVCNWTSNSIYFPQGPNITASIIPPFCDSAAVNILQYFNVSGVVSNYNWSFTGGQPSSSNLPNPGVVKYNAPGNYVISLIVDGPCGTDTLFATVVVSPKPVIDINPDYIYGCDTLTVNYINNITFGDYLWGLSNANNAQFVNSTNLNSPSPSLYFSSPGYYSLSVTASTQGCNPISDNFIVEIGEGPKLTQIQQIDDVCDSIFLNLTDYYSLSPRVSDSGYVWNVNYNGSTIYNYNGSNPNLVAIVDTGLYIVTVGVWNDCDSIILTDTFRYKLPPVLYLPSDTNICKGSGSIILSAIPSGGVWTYNGNFIGASFNSDSTNVLNNYFLYSYGSATCAVKDSFLVAVIGAGINAGRDTFFCSNSNPVNFTGSPTGGYWLGSGITDSIIGTYSPSYTNLSLDTVVYTFVDSGLGYNCIIRDTLNVIIFQPTASAYQIPDTACVNQSLLFSNNAPGTNSIWNFGDGSPFSFLNTVNHTYNISGNYPITLVYENQFGCKDTVETPLEIIAPPDASFVLDTNKGCSPLTINIDNLSSFYGANTYAWNYGNGVYDTIYNPGNIVFYQGPGDSTIYHLQLTTSNACGIATALDSITVYPIPVPGFGINYNDSCSPATIFFNNVTTGQPQYYEWYINGVLVSTDSILAPQVFVTDSLDSTYVIKLISSNRCGVDSISKSVTIRPNQVKAFFNADKVQGCRPLKCTFSSVVAASSVVSWDFGDGSSSFGDTVVHVFDTAGVFTVWQYVDNLCGFDSISQTIEVLPQPVLDFSMSVKGCNNDTIEITNLSPNISGYYWDFGDSSPIDSVAFSPNHIFEDPGIYNVTLIGFSSINGCPDTLLKSIQIVQHPEAEFVLSGINGCSPYLINLNSITPNASFYLWDLGNGDTLTGNPISYTYITPGQYSISLFLLDSNLCSDDTSYNFINVFPVPIADFNFIQNPICQTPTNLEFQNLSIGANNYDWLFGNIGQSVTINPILQVSDPQLLNVELISSNLYNCKDTIQKIIKVYGEPNASFIPLTFEGCVPLAINFINTSSNASNAFWNFGNGDTILGSSVFYTYNQIGQYDVTLIANEDSVCYDTLKVDNAINVLPIPTANFSFYQVDTIINPSGIYQFTDLSIDAVKWVWNFGDGSPLVYDKNPIHRFYNNGIFYVSLIVYNDVDCPDTAMYAIQVDFLGSLFIPNALSPDAGTIETMYFIPKGVGLASYNIEVFSPYGEKVWSSNKINNGQPEEKWDGTFNNKPVPQGAYVWKVDAIFQNGNRWNGMSYKGEPPSTYGSLMIIR